MNAEDIDAVEPFLAMSRDELITAYITNHEMRSLSDVARLYLYDRAVEREVRVREAFTKAITSIRSK